jgi:hypothetical protein
MLLAMRILYLMFQLGDTDLNPTDSGQIELYSHIPVLRSFVDQLKRWDFNVCAVYLLDSQVHTCAPSPLSELGDFQ